MAEKSKIFEDHYQDYCRQIASVDFASIKDRLKIQINNNIAQIQFFRAGVESGTPVGVRLSYVEFFDPGIAKQHFMALTL